MDSARGPVWPGSPTQTPYRDPFCRGSIPQETADRLPSCPPRGEMAGALLRAGVKQEQAAHRLRQPGLTLLTPPFRLWLQPVLLVLRLEVNENRKNRVSNQVPAS